jgi:NAD(P)-dependent dehydrogenase (short-subunit alcohol dehydrogenase family)
MVGAYSATKHAVQAIAEAMQDELGPFGIQVQTINPGPFLTGFNETMVEAVISGSMMSRSLLPAPWSERSRTVVVQSRRDGWIQRHDCKDDRAYSRQGWCAGMSIARSRGAGRRCADPDEALIILPQDRQ